MRSERLIRTAVLVATITMVGRLLGFFRDMTIAGLFGATADTDAYLIAWTIPETAAPLVLEGALLFVLIPLFSRTFAAEADRLRVMDETLTTLSTVLIGISGAVFISAPWLARLLGPGLADHDLAVNAVRLASPTLLLFGLAGFLTAALRTRNTFAITATVYVAYNVGIIASIFAFEPRLGVLSAALGLSFGAFLMVLIQVPHFATRVGHLRLRRTIGPEVRFALASFIPVGFFIIINHAQIYVERILASGLDAGSISRLNFAERIGQLPRSVVVAFAVVSFPSIARMAAEGDSERMKAAVHRDLAFVLTTIAPAIAFLVIAADDVVAFLLERGAFEATDTGITADVLQLYALGLVGQVVLAICILPLFSMHRTARRAVSAAAVGLLTTIVFDMALVASLDVAGLAIGNAAGVTTTAVLLMRAVDRHVFDIERERLRALFAKTSVAAAAAGLLTLGLRTVVEPSHLAFSVGLSAFSVLLMYITFAHMLRIDEMDQLVKALLPSGKRARTGDTR